MIELGEVVAKCTDCKKQFRGTLTLEVWDFGSFTNVGVVKGSLIGALAEHHDKNRKWGEEKAPQHAEFTVSQGGRLIGELGPISSMGSEHKFIIRDRGILEKFHEEIKWYQHNRGYRRWF